MQGAPLADPHLNHEVLAAKMTNEQLATLIDQLVHRPRQFSREERDAILHQASRRLRWRDDYEKEREGR